MDSNINQQTKFWTGDFGRQYTDRNISDLREMEVTYKKNFGITRRQMNKDFLGGLDRAIPILEVGCNVGNQLALLSEFGFSRLYGIDVSDYALEIAKRRDETQGISFLRGSVFNLPFKDGSFGMVFTSGVLIHIHPNNILKAIGEIYRCTSSYIWGFEYYANEYQEVSYRGQANLLWKTDL